MSDYIPSEIQIKIFCQLPVKSILRFRSVSKEWKSLIDSSEFNSDYIVHQTQPKRLFLRLYRGRVDDDLEKGEYCMIVDDDDDDSFPLHKISLRYPQSVKLIRKNNKCLEFVGSSYGLVCFTGVYLGEDDCFDRYVIWNPSIRKSVTIDVPYNLCMDEYGYKFLFVGFGVCPKSLDPKIVRMIMCDVPNDYYNNNKHGCEHNRFVRVEVFTLSEGVWRRPLTKSKWSHIYIEGRTNSVVVNGFIYWRCRYKSAHEIISFNLTSEEFTKIHVPSNISRFNFQIFKLRESVGVVQYRAPKGSYDLWLMDHVSKSFMKLYNFTLPHRWKVVGFRDNELSL